MENLVTANGKCQDHLPRWDRKRTRVLVQLGVKDGCQVLWLLESWPTRHVSRCQRGGLQALCPVSPLTSTRQAAAPDDRCLQGLCLVWAWCRMLHFSVMGTLPQEVGITLHILQQRDSKSSGTCHVL